MERFETPVNPNPHLRLKDKLHYLGAATWTHTQLGEIGKESIARIEEAESELSNIRAVLRRILACRSTRWDEDAMERRDSDWLSAIDEACDILNDDSMRGPMV